MHPASASTRPGRSPGSPEYTASRLCECPDCGQMQVMPAMPPGARAVCVRCETVLRHTRRNPLTLPLVLNLSALILFLLGATLTIMSVSSAGQERVASLGSEPLALQEYGMGFVALIVLATTMAIPLTRLLCTLVVLLGLRLRHPPAELRGIFAWVAHLRPWSMIEIFLLALFVAYVRLKSMATVDIGPAVYALAGLLLITALADALLDEQAVWEAMEPERRRRRRAAQPIAQAPQPPVSPNRQRIGCPTCGLVSRTWSGTPCPRCGFRLHARKPYSLQRTWALAVAAVVLYIPANTFPVLTVIRLGAGQPSTILGGVEELIQAQMWPLAALVFFASIAVPMLKLIGLTLLLITTHLGSRWGLRDRTTLYRIIDAIGRWSMIDIFMGAILVALVRFGRLASVYPGPGAIAFASVVILTMLAAHSLDPRLMWDSAQRSAIKSAADQSSAGRPGAGV